MSSPGLWDDNDRAQALLKERTELQAQLAQVDRPVASLDDVEVLIELAEVEDDASLKALDRWCSAVQRC